MRNLQFPELPRQWSSHGYEIDELLGQGSYGAVYRMVRNKGILGFKSYREKSYKKKNQIPIS